MNSAQKYHSAEDVQKSTNHLPGESECNSSAQLGLSLSNKSLLYAQKCSTACCLFEIYLHDNRPVRLASALIKCCVMIIVIGEVESEKCTVHFYRVFNGFRFLPTAI